MKKKKKKKTLKAPTRSIAIICSSTQKGINIVHELCLFLSITLLEDIFFHFFGNHHYLAQNTYNKFSVVNFCCCNSLHSNEIIQSLCMDIKFPKMLYKHWTIAFIFMMFKLYMLLWWWWINFVMVKWIFFFDYTHRYTYASHGTLINKIWGKSMLHAIIFITFYCLSITFTFLYNNIHLRKRCLFFSFKRNCRYRVISYERIL